MSTLMSGILPGSAGIVMTSWACLSLAIQSLYSATLGLLNDPA